LAHYRSEQQESKNQLNAYEKIFGFGLWLWQVADQSHYHCAPIKGLQIFSPNIDDSIVGRRQMGLKFGIVVQ
jgi:hypothetical protein